MVNGLSVLEIISVALVMIAVPLISIPKRLGLWIMLASQMTWAVWGYFESKPFFFFQCLYLILFNIIGLYQWKKKGIK